MGDLGSHRDHLPSQLKRPAFPDSTQADAVMRMASRVLFLEREIHDLRGTVRGLEKKIDRLVSMLGERLPKPASTRRQADGGAGARRARRTR